MLPNGRFALVSAIMFDLEQYLAIRASWIEESLEARLPPADAPPAVLHEAMRYSVMAGGKRLRPILCLAAAEASRAPVTTRKRWSTVSWPGTRKSPTSVIRPVRASFIDSIAAPRGCSSWPGRPPPTGVSSTN